MSDDTAVGADAALIPVLIIGVLMFTGVVIVTDVALKKLKKILACLHLQYLDREQAQKRARPSTSEKSKRSKKSKKSKPSQQSKQLEQSKKSSTGSSPRRIKLSEFSPKKRKIQTIAKYEQKYDYESEKKLFNGDLPTLMRRLAPFLEDYRDHPEQHDVCNPTVVPGFLYNALPSHPPEEPCKMDDVWNDYKNLVWTGVTKWQHPYFLAYFPCGRSVPDTLAEILISSVAAPTSSWYMCPSLAELEMSMVNWMGRALGLPEEMLYHGNVETSQGGGLILESASESIFQAVTASRTKKINEKLAEEHPLTEHFHADPRTRNNMEKHHEIAGRLINYSSTEAHSSIEKACRMAMVEMRPLKGDPKRDFALTAEILEKAIKEDLAAGKIPCMLNVILGSTSSCCFDELDEIGPVAKKYGMWIHADSAYAGSMWVDPALRATQKGIQYLDSIDINPHKILLHSNGMSMLWTTDLAQFRKTYGRYEAHPWNPMGDDGSTMAMHDTRRHKGLKSWFIFRQMGVDGMRDFIRRIVAASSHLHSLVVTHPNVRMFGPLKPGVFTFQYVEPGMNEEQISYHSECVHRLMNETGRIWITYTRVHGHGIIRVATGYEKVSSQDMDNLWEIMKQCIDTYREKRSDPALLRYPPASPTPLR